MPDEPRRLVSHAEAPDAEAPDAEAFAPEQLAPGLVVRPAHDDDALGVIELLGGVFGEYAHCVLDVDGEMPELRAVATHFAAAGGAFWVAERTYAPGATRVVGCVGWAPHDHDGAPGVELKKLYVHRSERGTGLGPALTARVEAVARARGARQIELWSDTRFTRAHAFYARRGYVRGGTRELHDKSDTVEFHFVLPLTG